MAKTKPGVLNLQGQDETPSSQHLAFCSDS